MDFSWMRDAGEVRFSALAGDIHTDVLIIGGGIAGILCAYKLREAGVDFILVEADRICQGITGFNKWGMTNAMVAADILCDLVKGKTMHLCSLRRAAYFILSLRSMR